MEQGKIKLMESTPVRSAIWKLALPTMIAMAVQMIYSLTDTFFIGQTNDPNLIAALSLATPIFMLNQAIGNIFANGTSSYISRKLGGKDKEEANHANSVAFYTAILIGMVFTILLLVFREPILGVIGTSIDTYQPTKEYYTIIVAFATPLILQTAMSGLVRSEGATGSAMFGMLLGIGLNIILDPIFILVLDMGVAGAAWATVIGAIVGTIYYIIHFMGKKTILSIHPKEFKPSKVIYSETFKIGIPAALSTAVMSVSFIIINVIAVGYGDIIVAANGIFLRVSNMVVMLAMGLTQGYQPFAGYNYGANDFSRLKKGFIYTIIYSTLISVFFTLIFGLFGENIVGLFINDKETIEAGTQILHAFNWCVPFIGFQFTMMVTFQATGKALKSMLLALGRQLIIYLPLLFIFNHLFGFDGFIFAQPTADILTTIIAVLMSISFIKEMNYLMDGKGVVAEVN